jgi:hypothetical protein
MFIDMAIMVEGQGVVLDQIETHVNSAVLDTRDGTKLMGEAIVKQKSSRKVCDWVFLTTSLSPLDVTLHHVFIFVNVFNCRSFISHPLLYCRHLLYRQMSRSCWFGIVFIIGPNILIIICLLKSVITHCILLQKMYIIIVILVVVLIVILSSSLSAAFKSKTNA